MSSTTAPLLRAALSGQHQSNHPSDAAAPARPAGAPEADMPEERLAFALSEWRAEFLEASPATTSLVWMGDRVL
jgi:hypothetical protein